MSDEEIKKLKRRLRTVEISFAVQSLLLAAFIWCMAFLGWWRR